MINYKLKVNEIQKAKNCIINDNWNYVILDFTYKDSTTI